MKMKAKHWLIVGLVLVGGLYLIHNYMSHGGVSGVKQGIGLGGFSFGGQARNAS